MLKNIYILVIFLGLPFVSFAQLFSISGSIKDSKGQALGNVNIEIAEKPNFSSLSDEQGLFIIPNLPQGSYLLKFSHIGFKPITRTIKLDNNRETHIVFNQDEVNIDEVYVTAKESKNIGTSSIITRDAMQHLQPSSFTDLLELLPGGQTKSPVLDQVNGINLRTANGASMSAYSTGSLGTMFSVDGMQLNSQSMVDPTAGFELGQGSMNNGRSTANIAVDMRTIATDNIEKVEIIRGIPSVEYGNLTSGVVLIDRIKGYEPWTARIKADGFSKLLGVGKGFEFGSYKLNIDGGYLNSRSNVTDIYNTFKRINTSIRGEKTWNLNNYRFIWNHGLDFNTTIDNERLDPDNDYKLTDRYKNNVQFFGFNNTFKLFSSNPKSTFRNVTFGINARLSSNQIDMQKLVQARTATILMNSMVSGSHEAIFMTPSYVGEFKSDSRPLDINLKLVGNWSFNRLFKQQVKAGLEYAYAKNLGLGPQYDLDFPISTSINARPRSLRSIPAMSNLSLFAEDRFFINIGDLLFENNLGVRAFSLTNLEKEYALSGKVFVDPRYNGRLHLPQISVFGKQLKSNVFAGYGIQTLAPNQNLLYPQNFYRDIPELVYYHNNPAYRLAWATTNIVNPVNYALEAAKNIKWEIGTQLDFEGNTFSINYFNEKLDNGFRNISVFDAVSLRKYNVTSVDPNTLTAKPSIEDFTYVDQAEFHSYTQNSNGSITEKQGLEYNFSSKRIQGINTRFTVNGAWFRTFNANNQPVMEVISPLEITDGKVRQYVGVYANGNTGGHYESFNTNLTADSFLPKLGMNLSMSVQSFWYKSKQSLFRDNLPIGYLDIDQNYHNYTEADRNDPILRLLDRKVDPYLYNEFKEPIDLLVNFKATKVIKNRIRVAMFVNRLFIYKPDYSQYGNQFIRRNRAEDNPYFGMEVNIKI